VQKLRSRRAPDQFSGAAEQQGRRRQSGKNGLTRRRGTGCTTVRLDRHVPLVFTPGHVQLRHCEFISSPSQLEKLSSIKDRGQTDHVTALIRPYAQEVDI